MPNDYEPEKIDFGAALKALKVGMKVKRIGWNGKGQYVYHVPEGAYDPCTPAVQELVNENGKVKYRAYIALKTVQGDVVPWQPSISDVLAEDWIII